MIIKMPRLVTVASLVVALSSCGTTPNSNYYVLQSDATAGSTDSTLSLGVGPIEIPEYLNRHTIVFSRLNNQLSLASFERWAEPLDSGIERVVRLNLASLLNTQNVQTYPWGSSEKPEYAVQISVLRFDASSNGAELIAEWRLHRPNSEKTILRQISRLQDDQQRKPMTAEDVAPAYSRLLLQLSEVIAAAISDAEIQAASSASR